ncbi:MAG: carboxymuconolactone decarboxylase family protein [Usitatibacter sp.]
MRRPSTVLQIPKHTETAAMPARIAPAAPPFAPEIEERLKRVMPPGVPPLLLFTTLARDRRLFERFSGGSLIDRGHLTLRQREIVVDRVTARCASEYEWGVHVAFFAAKAGLTGPQLASLVHGGASDSCWSPDEALLIRLCDALDRSCDVDDALWGDLRGVFSEEALIELLMLAGFYRTVSYLTNAMRLPLEDFAARFPPRHPPP